MLLNYLGPNIGAAGPLAAQLPQGAPGTMPGGVPGVARANVPPPSPPIHAAPALPPPGAHPAALGKMPPSPQALAAILQGAHGGGLAGGLAGLAGGPPPLPQYGTHTQDDGSVLMFLKNPDGSPGSVVKIIPPIKRGQA